jgi:hypothetical protein
MFIFILVEANWYAKKNKNKIEDQILDLGWNFYLIFFDF